MKSILGIGNALTDVLVRLPNDSLLQKFHLPIGSMQHVDEETGDKIWKIIKPLGATYVAGGSAANTICDCAIFGMKAGFIGKVGDDELGSLFRSDMERNGVNPNLMIGKASSGRCTSFITGPNAERTMATYLGAALELDSADLHASDFEGYDYFHIEGYLVQNQSLLRKAVEMAKAHKMIVSIDLASYNVVDSNNAFLHDIVQNYVDIVFANEREAESFTREKPREAADAIAKMCKIAVVKVGKDGSMIKSGGEFCPIRAVHADAIDATGAGDTYAAGFLYAHSLGASLRQCGEIGSIIAAKAVEVLGAKINVPRWKNAKRNIRRVLGTR